MAAPSDVGAKLDALAEKRERQQHDVAELSAEIKAAVAAAQGAKMPMTEIARRLHLDRSVVYRVYLAA